VAIHKVEPHLQPAPPPPSSSERASDGAEPPLSPSKWGARFAARNASRKASAVLDVLATFLVRRTSDDMMQFRSCELLMAATAEPAPEPSTIQWVNLEFSPMDRFRRRMKTWAASLSLVALNFTFIATIKLIQNSDSYSEALADPIISLVVDLIIGIVIVTINFLLKLVNRSMMGQEHHPSREDEQNAMFNKLAISS